MSLGVFYPVSGGVFPKNQLFGPKINDVLCYIKEVVPTALECSAALLIIGCSCIGIAIQWHPMQMLGKTAKPQHLTPWSCFPNHSVKHWEMT